MKLQNEKTFLDSHENGYSVYTRNTCQRFVPHTHDVYEIFMVLENQMDYYADGIIYPLAPKELVAVRGTLPHGKVKVGTGLLEYMVILLSKDFFVQNDCMQYEEIFNPRVRGDRKISAATCESSGLYDVYKRLKKYTKDFTDTENIITRTLLIEFLHVLNANTHFSQTYTTHPQVEKALDYIDKNLTKKLTLDEIAQHAFLSKYHLCRLFKEYVGCTVNQYITLKRIEKTQALVSEKKNLTAACIEAGFSDYSAFYKAFKREHGASPKFLLKKK